MTIEEFFDQQIARAKNLEELSKIPGYILASVSMRQGDNGESLLQPWIERQQVQRIGNYRLEVRPKEQCHKLPHFHIVSPDWEASFSLPDVELIAGEPLGGARWKVLRKFLDRLGTRNALIDGWNSCRPTDCPIGSIIEAYNYRN